MAYKIALTGASGFVGKNLSAYLKKTSACELTQLTRNSLSELVIYLQPHLDAIIHLAGKAHDLKNVSDPDEYYEVNFDLTKKLYDSFLQSNLEKFIFISSVKATADYTEVDLTEDTYPNPTTHYGKSKLMAENYIKSQPLPKGKSYFILRPCMIHGPGNKGNLNLLYKFVKKGIPYPLGGFKNKRSFLSVENLCFIINELITRNDIPSGVYQVADDEALSTNEVVFTLATALNIKPKLWKISPAIVKFFAKVSDILHLPLTTERLNKLTESYVVSNQKIKKVLNKDLPLTAIEGLKITVNTFKKN